MHADWIEQEGGGRGFERIVEGARWSPWWRGEEMHSHIPSCASAAVLVVGAAGLVCCRPTIGQRGVELGEAMEFFSNPLLIKLSLFGFL